LNVGRQGKRVVLNFDDGASLVVALGMTGRLTVVSAREPLLSHTHLRVTVVGTGEELRFRDPRRFGGLWFVDAARSSADGNGTTRERVAVAESSRPSALGPDALSIRLPRFRALLERDRQIKALLLDQRLIAGMGNIYCDEALHRAGIHPLRRARSLTPEESATLLRHMRRVLRAAIRFGGSTFMDYRNADGRPGGFQLKHRVYNREGLPCRSCKTPIVRIQAAGRSSHVCPRCQIPADALRSRSV
jgi:formamidopyrimidine-DNA glycosylase